MSDDSSTNDELGTLRAAIKQAVTDVREQTPLAQSFTNFVTINLVANAQLAAGGTAAMSYLPDDVIATAEIAGSNYINVAHCYLSLRTRCQKSHTNCIRTARRGYLIRSQQALVRRVRPSSNRSAPTRRPLCAAMRAKSLYSTRCGDSPTPNITIQPPVRPEWKPWTK